MRFINVAQPNTTDGATCSRYQGPIQINIIFNFIRGARVTRRTLIQSIKIGVAEVKKSRMLVPKFKRQKCRIQHFPWWNSSHFQWIFPVCQTAACFWINVGQVVKNKTKDICWMSVFSFFFYEGSTPEDEAPAVPVSDTFMVPRKEISMVPDMGKWKRSQVGVAFKSSSLLHDFPNPAHKVP